MSRLPTRMSSLHEESPVRTSHARFVKSSSVEPKVDKPTKEDYKRMSIQLADLKKDNDHLLAKQEKKFGITVDAAEALKADMEQARAENNALLMELERGKQLFNKLHASFVDLQTKFKSCKQQIRELKKEKQLWDETKQMLKVSEERCKKLTNANRNMKHLLLKHNINPDLDANTILMHSPPGMVDTYRKSSASKRYHRERRPINAVSPRKKVITKKMMWK